MHRDCAASPAFPGDSPPPENFTPQYARRCVSKNRPSTCVAAIRARSRLRRPQRARHASKHAPHRPAHHAQCDIASSQSKTRGSQSVLPSVDAGSALRQHRQSEHLTRTLKKRRAHMPTICARHRGGGCTRFNAGGETPASFHAALTEPSCRWPPRQRRSSYEGWSGRRRPSERWRS